jgi:hypothetical protein
LNEGIVASRCFPWQWTQLFSITVRASAKVPPLAGGTGGGGGIEQLTGNAAAAANANKLGGAVGFMRT